ncbi:hypothetical protein HHI36_017327 [Cryptolaemus montrouzieri]|uniref:Uncharacterized protein n=1 Tax=Cryptolaemus montrouzieri TaxID=559131 RepID=A0ABD2NMX9_9CUCU
MELIGIDKSNLQLSNFSPNSSFRVQTTQDFFACNSCNEINPSEHPNNEETNISPKGSEKDNDDEDPNYELAAEAHFNNKASKKSASILLEDDLANHSKKVQGRRKRKKRKVRYGWIQEKTK